MRYSLLIGIILVTALNAAGQYRYVNAEFNLRDSTNTNFLHYQRNLPEIVINGFLSGKLKGYPYPVKQTPVFSAEPTWPKPPEWSPSAQYWYSDTVLFKGNYYRLLFDAARGNSPDRDDNWEKYDRRSILKYVYSWPRDEDIYSVETFERKRLIEQGSGHPVWEKSVTYYPYDAVIFQGKIFLALTESKGEAPGKDNSYWQFEGYQYNVVQAGEFMNGVILYHRSDAGMNEPQMITFQYQGNDYISISFYFDEVIRYLNTLNQPIYFDAALKSAWYTGDLFYPGYNSSQHLGSTLLQYLQKKKITTKKVIPLDSGLTKPALLYQEQGVEYLAVPQIENGKVTFINFFGRGGNYKVPLPVFLKAAASESKLPQWKTYAQTLMEGNFVNIRKDTLSFDGLDPLKLSSADVKCNKIKFQQELHLQQFSSPSLITKFIFQAIIKNELSVYSGQVDSARYSKSTWLESLTLPDGNVLSSEKFHDFSLVYDISWSNGVAQATYDISKLGFFALDENTGIMRGGYVQWNELKAAIEKHLLPGTERNILLLEMNNLVQGKLVTIRQTLIQTPICSD